jgi:hypothetical protein
MVILTDLEREPRNNPFGLHVTSDRAAKDIDWKNPLADRWLRFWPWPFGPQKKDVVLDTTAFNSPEGQEAVSLGGRLPFAGSPDMAKVGEALHRFLAADDPAFVLEMRIVMATRLLDAWGVTGLDPRDVVTMGDRFRAFVSKQWPTGILLREAPITHRLGDQTLSGRIDAVIETSEEMVVIDHKSFPGARSQWQAQAEKYVGQLQLYGNALRAASDRPKEMRMALHLPISGELLIVEAGTELRRLPVA